MEEIELKDTIGYCDGLGCGRGNGTCFCVEYYGMKQEFRKVFEIPWRAATYEQQKLFETGWRFGGMRYGKFLDVAIENIDGQQNEIYRLRKALASIRSGKDNPCFIVDEALKIRFEKKDVDVLRHELEPK